MEVGNREKCTKQSVLIASKSVKCHSNPILADQFTAENVGQKEDHQEEDIKLTS
jgi:hypothetical protein